MQSARNADEAQRQAEIAQQNEEEARASEAEANRQQEIAEERTAEAEAAAVRADRTARRLIDFVIRPQDPSGQLGSVLVPRDATPLRPPETSLPKLSDPPESVRLAFTQGFCDGPTCYQAPAFVRDGVRTTYSTSYGTEWLAHEPFHIRHGFDGLGIERIDDALASGYSVRFYLSRINGSPEGRFDLGSAYRVEATAVLEGDSASCGPDLPGPEAASCAEWVFDFPDGLPPGTYELVLEWVAPCAAWFETDVCASPALPVGLHFVGGIVSFLSEDFLRPPGCGCGPDRDWPFDPWKRSEPIPELDA